MKLLWLRVSGFRQARELRLAFAREKDADPALAFIIGPNGAGKSRVLEMLGRIFSHLSAGIPVGLDFDIEYELGERRVLITTCPPPDFSAGPVPPKLERIDAWMLVADARSDRWLRRHVVENWPGESELDRLLPYRVVGLSAGPASRLDHALRGAVLDSLGQRLDLGDPQSPPPDMPAKEWETHLEEERSLLAEQLRRIASEPRCVALSGNELLLAILALLTHPNSIEDGDEARDAILERVGLDARRSLRAFSIDVAADWKTRMPGMQQEPFQDLLDQAARRIAQEGEPVDAESDAERGQRAVFECKQSLQAWVGRSADSPFIWFSQLLGWLKMGVLRSVRLVLSRVDGPGLLLDDDFSDGEFLLAGRYALLLLLREHRNCLVLFDEPETHFNDLWKVDLISDLVRVLEGNRAQVVIATHSDLTLSDADRSDVYVLSADSPADGAEVPTEPPVSPFAADRGEITAQVFGAGQTSGTHALSVVNQALASNDREQLREALKRVGPGFHSFRLRYALTEEEGEADAP
ncbi:MAG TPA: AAA family ATPase [Solirubrobacterales bacterium]|jgi:energy-coupling factor transporter ATP-binding protein EcfA2